MGDVASKKESLEYKDDDYPTNSSEIQKQTELECFRFYTPIDSMSNASVEQLVEIDVLNPETKQVKLLRSKTVDYLRRGLTAQLGPSYTSLAASRPWLVYWMLHALELLNAFPADLVENIRETLSYCVAAEKRGFGGGFMQVGHTAPTYAAVLAIVTLGDKKSYDMIDRKAIYEFFLSLKDKSGGFHVQKDGEMDTRGLYTVLAVASILNILTPELTENCADFVSKCQTYEGGIGGEPGNEAHGGYAFCALAALAILERQDAINLDAFVDWLAKRQMALEGGFQGRTNKLVDACYSFWQGAAPAILEKYFGVQYTGENVGSVGTQIYDQERMQQYLILCCQFQEGGLRDKPGKSRDQYHTCYALSGLSVSQHHDVVVWGDISNRLKETDPIYNVQVDKLRNAMDYFYSLPDIQ